MPPRYELFPSCFIDVISQLKQLIKMKFYPNQLAKRYLMIGAPQDVSSDELDHLVNGVQEPVVNPYKGIGRNDPCPCKSGLKFKKCCGKNL